MTRHSLRLLLVQRYTQAGCFEGIVLLLVMPLLWLWLWSQLVRELVFTLSS